jgi:hypothetical protein
VRLCATELSPGGVRGKPGVLDAICVAAGQRISVLLRLVRASGTEIPVE